MNPHRPPGRFPTKFVRHSGPHYGQSVSGDEYRGSWRPMGPRGPHPERPTKQDVYQQPRTLLTPSRGSFNPRAVNPYAPRPVPPWRQPLLSTPPYRPDRDPYTKDDYYSQGKRANISKNYDAQSEPVSNSGESKSSDFMSPGSTYNAFSAHYIGTQFDYNHGKHSSSQQAVGGAHTKVSCWDTQPLIKTSEGVESVHTPPPVSEKETAESFLKTWNKLTKISSSHVTPVKNSNELPQSEESKETGEETEVKDTVSNSETLGSMTSADKPKAKSITFNWKNPSVIGTKTASSLPSKESISSTSTIASAVSMATASSNVASTVAGQATTQQLFMAPSYSQHGSWRPMGPRGPHPERPTKQDVYQQPRTLLTPSRGSFNPRAVNPYAPRPVPPWRQPLLSTPPYRPDRDPYTKDDYYSQGKRANISKNYDAQSEPVSNSGESKSSDFMSPGSTYNAFSAHYIGTQFDYNHEKHSSSQQAVGGAHTKVNCWDTQPLIKTSEGVESVHTPPPVSEKETAESFLKTWNKLTKISSSHVTPVKNSNELPQSEESKETGEETEVKDTVSNSETLGSMTSADKPKAESITFNWKNPSVIGTKTASSLPSKESISSTSTIASAVSMATASSNVASTVAGQATTQQLFMAPSYSQHASWPRGPQPERTNQLQSVYQQPRTALAPSKGSFYPRGVNQSAAGPVPPWHQPHPSRLAYTPERGIGDFSDEYKNAFSDFQSSGWTDDTLPDDCRDGKYHSFDSGRAVAGLKVRGESGFEYRGGQVRQSLLSTPDNVDYRVKPVEKSNQLPQSKVSHVAETTKTTKSLVTSTAMSVVSTSAANPTRNLTTFNWKNPSVIEAKETSFPPSTGSTSSTSITKSAVSMATPLSNVSSSAVGQATKQMFMAPSSSHYVTPTWNNSEKMGQHIDYREKQGPQNMEVNKGNNLKDKAENNITCSVCNISIPNDEAYEKHIKGLLHTNRMQTAQQNESKKTSQNNKLGSSCQVPAIANVTTKQGTKQPDKGQTTDNTEDSENSDEDDTSKCIYCNMTFTNPDSYVKHTRGMLHTQNLMAAEAAKREGTFETVETKSAIEETKDIQVHSYKNALLPTSVRMSQKFADDVTDKTEEDYDFNSSNWMDIEYQQTKKVPAKERDLDPSDIGQQKKNEWHCKVCDINCTGEENFQMHLDGNKHKSKLKLQQNVEAVLGVAESSELTDASLAKLQEASITEYLKKSKLPVLGLQYLTEYQDIINPKQNRYVCNLCEAKCDRNTLTSHLVGTKHRLRYFKEDYPAIYGHLSKFTGKKKSELSKSLDEFAVDIFAEEGMQQMKVKVGSHPEVETHLLQLLSKQGIIRPEVAQVIKELGKTPDESKESKISKAAIEDKLLNKAGTDRKRPLMESPELSQVKRMKEYDGEEKVSSVYDSIDGHRDHRLGNQYDDYYGFKKPKGDFKQVYDYGHTKPEVIGYYHSPSTKPQTVDSHSPSTEPQTVEPPHLPPTKPQTVEPPHLPSTKPQTVEPPHLPSTQPQTVESHHLPSTELQTGNIGASKEQMTTYTDSSKEKLFEEFLEWKNFKEMKMLSMNMSSQSTSLNPPEKPPQPSTEKGQEQSLNQGENQTIVVNNSPSSQFSQDHGEKNSSQALSSQESIKPFAEGSANQQIPSINVKEMIGNLSSSLIKSEDEAAMVLEVSNALTQALLQYRLKHVPDEVKSGLAKVIDKPKHSESQKKLQETSKKSESTSTKSGKETVQIPSSSTPAVKKRVASGYSLPPISLPETKVPKITESSNKGSLMSTVKGQRGQPTELGEPSTAIPKTPMRPPTAIGPPTAMRPPTAIGPPTAMRPPTAVGPLTAMRPPTALGPPTAMGPSTGAGVKPSAATQSLAGQTRVPVQGQVAHDLVEQQGYISPASLSAKPTAIPKFPDQLATAGAVSSLFPLQSEWQNMSRYPGQATMVYTQQIALSQNSQTQYMNYYMPSATIASNLPPQGFVPHHFPHPDQPPLPPELPPQSKPQPPPPPPPESR